MKNLYIAVICFFAGVFLVLGYRYVLALRARPAVFAPTASPLAPTPFPTFALVPPSQAVSGVLTVLTGHTEKFSRNADAYAEASSGAQILTGESVMTKDQSGAVASISGIVNVTLGSTAELVFTNLFPSNMILQQKSGKITYDVTDTDRPVAVRALHSLISLESGKTTINIIDTDMSVTVETGSAKLALVDTDNNTHVWELTGGRRANIDDTARQVYFTSPRKEY